MWEMKALETLITNIHIKGEQMKKISTPLTKETIQGLKAGDQILLSGTLLTARDAAHKKMVECIEKGEPLPFEIKGQIIYYTGPCPPKPEMVIGSSGPTTSGRMDKYTPRLLDIGLAGMIGKGDRNSEVIESMKKNRSIYFGAVGGAGALIAKCIASQKVIAWPELGTEAVREIDVIDFPLIVLIDSKGNNLYKTGRKQYRKA